MLLNKVIITIKIAIVAWWCNVVVRKIFQAFVLNINLQNVSSPSSIRASKRRTRGRWVCRWNRSTSSLRWPTATIGGNRRRSALVLETRLSFRRDGSWMVYSWRRWCRSWVCWPTSEPAASAAARPRRASFVICLDFPVAQQPSRLQQWRINWSGKN